MDIFTSFLFHSRYFMEQLHCFQAYNYKSGQVDLLRTWQILENGKGLKDTIRRPFQAQPLFLLIRKIKIRISRRIMHYQRRVSIPSLVKILIFKQQWQPGH